MAKPALLRITGDSVDAKRAVRDAAAEVRQFGTLSAQAKIDVATAGIDAKLEQLRSRLDRLGSQEVTPKVTIQTAKVIAEIDRLEVKKAELGRDVDIKVKVDGQNTIGSLATDVTKGLANALQSAASSVPVLGGALGGLASAGGAGAGGIESFGAALAALGPAALVVAAAIAILLPLIVSLVASFAAAVAGAGVLLGALAGALAPAVILVVAVVAKLISAMTALNQQQEAAANKVLQVQGAQDGVRSATENLAQAQQNLQQQTTAAWDAYHQSIQTVRNDLLAVQDAQLGVESAKVNADAAKQGLKDLLSSFGDAQTLFKKFQDVSFTPGAIPDVLGGASKQLTGDQRVQLEQALLRVKESTQGIADAQNNVTNATERLNHDRATEQGFITQGIKAYPAYASALNQVRTSTEALTRAQLALTRAQQAPLAVQQISPSLAKAATGLLDLWDRVKGVFTPAFNAVLGGISRGMNSFATAVSNPGIKTALTGLGTALGQAFARIGAFFADPRSVQAMQQFLGAATQLVRPLTTLFITFAKILRDLGTDALPALVKGISGFAGNASTWEKHHGGAKKLQGTVDGLVHSFNIWIGIIGDLGKILLAFLGGAKGSGDSLATSIKHALDHFVALLDSPKGKNAIHHFFEQAITDARTLWGVLGGIVSAINQIVSAINGLNPANWFPGGNAPNTQTNPVGAALHTVTNAARDLIGTSTPVGDQKNKDLISAVNSQDPGAIKRWIQKYGHAAGGIFNVPTFGVLGEAGPEAVIPLKPDILAKIGAGMNSGRSGDTIHLHVTTPDGQLPDGHILAAQVGQILAKRGH